MMPRLQGSRRPPPPKKPPLTHFLCLPLVTPSSRPQLQTSIESFRNHVSPADQPEQMGNTVTRIHLQAIRPVGVLHLTLGVMSLNKEQLQKAITLLETLEIEKLLTDTDASTTSNPSSTTSTHTQTEGNNNNNNPNPIAKTSQHAQPPSPIKPITINLTGLASMHAPQNTSILYIDPSDASQRLYPFCLALQKTLTDKGVLLPDDRGLKLHATIVNTIYTKGEKRPVPNRGGRRVGTAVDGGPSSSLGEQRDDDRSQGHGPSSNAPLKIDARALLEEYKDFVWAEDVVLDRIAICEMGAKKRFDGDGDVVGEEYTEVASVGLPVG